MEPVWLACLFFIRGKDGAEVNRKLSTPGKVARRQVPHAVYGWSLLVFPCCKRFFLSVIHFFRLPKPSIHKFQFDLERVNTFRRVNSLHLHYSCPRSLPACSRDGKSETLGTRFKCCVSTQRKKVCFRRLLQVSITGR